ncbi:hypothetical protein NJ959_02545 [Symplocastrum sp. BBK-W-15]|uniref:DUF4352 domain-containing protein n=1 Tax=Limnofasciculus baicalensis BBK-W-15 TaxID=2699891 RepID=A0AAE3KL69_9CYAN|nr:hypothetical protein [Limnofasciculus baicalensis BBK-W-15]
MLRKYLLAVALATATLPFIAIVPEAHTIPSRNERRSQNYDGWQVEVKSYRTTGKTIQTERGTFNAEQTWLAVLVSIRKTKIGGSGNPPIGFVNALLVDANGFVYPVTRIDYKSRSIGDPFRLGEVRLEDLLFDVPQGTRAAQLIINSSDGEELLRLKV